MKTTDTQRAYSRGYSAGRGNKWPSNKPPLPPNEHAAAIIKAAIELRNAVDSEMATFDEDDEMALRLYVYVDALDEAMKRVDRWLTTPDTAGE